jgi:hypothetical protein
MKINIKAIIKGVNKLEGQEDKLCYYTSPNSSGSKKLGGVTLRYVGKEMILDIPEELL